MTLLVLLMFSTLVIAETFETRVGTIKIVKPSILDSFSEQSIYFEVNGKTILTSKIGDKVKAVMQFVPKCDSAHKFISYLSIGKDGKKISEYPLDFSGSNCNIAQIRYIYFTPSTEGTYQFRYQVMDYNLGGERIELNTCVNNAIQCDISTKAYSDTSFLFVSNTMPIGTYSPYCEKQQAGTESIIVDGTEVGTRAKQTCYDENKLSYTKSIVSCFSGYKISGTTCVKDTSFTGTPGEELKFYVINHIKQICEKANSGYSDLTSCQKAISTLTKQICNNGLCEKTLGETSVTCPSDCTEILVKECEQEGILEQIQCFDKDLTSNSIQECVKDSKGNLKIKINADSCPACTINSDCTEGYSCVDSTCVVPVQTPEQILIEHQETKEEEKTEEESDKPLSEMSFDEITEKYGTTILIVLTLIVLFIIYNRNQNQ